MTWAFTGFHIRFNQIKAMWEITQSITIGILILFSANQLCCNHGFISCWLGSVSVAWFLHCYKYEAACGTWSLSHSRITQHNILLSYYKEGDTHVSSKLKDLLLHFKGISYWLKGKRYLLLLNVVSLTVNAPLWC